jgi:hypothetical protein
MMMNSFSSFLLVSWRRRRRRRRCEWAVAESCEFVGEKIVQQIPS